MTCQIYTDQREGEVSEFYHSQIVKARKEHVCLECGGPILIGQQYEKVSAKWDDCINTISTCLVCLEVRNEFFCTWTHGTMWADFECEAEYEDFDMSHLGKLSKAAINAISEHL